MKGWEGVTTLLNSTTTAVNAARKVLDVVSSSRRQEVREGAAAALDAAVAAVNLVRNVLGDISQQREVLEGVISALDVVIIAVNLSRVVLGVSLPAEPVFRAVCALLTKLRVCFLLRMIYLMLTCIQDVVVDQMEDIELELECADNCRAIDRVVKGKALDYLGQPVRDAVNQFMV